MKLKNIFIKGFKSIDNVTGQNIPLGDVTVLLGANGSGKSNLVSFFKMLNFMMSGALKQYVDRQQASRIFFYGYKKTEAISFTLEFKDDSATDTYRVKLAHGLPDRLIFTGEEVTYQKTGYPVPQQYLLEGANNESGLKGDTNPTSKVLYALLSGIRVYQFHDTSDTAKIKDSGYMEDAQYLRDNAGNLAAFLKMLKETPEFEKYYHRVVRRIRRVMPQFGDFDIMPLPNAKDYVRLNWTDSSGGDYLFDPHQISDGSLRFMALTALLLQPPDLLPKFIVIDEPELGLHPAAIAELCGMVKIAAENAQVLLATQSTRLLDEFGPENLVIVERDESNHCSVFKTHTTEDLSEWLTRYSISELWEKSVLGGQP